MQLARREAARLPGKAAARGQLQQPSWAALKPTCTWRRAPPAKMATARDTECGRCGLRPYCAVAASFDAGDATRFRPHAFRAWRLQCAIPPSPQRAACDARVFTAGALSSTLESAKSAFLGGAPDRDSVRRLRRRLTLSALAPSAVDATANSWSARPTDLTLSCAARFRVPKPKRRGGCRRNVACTACRTATAVTPSRWR